MKKHLHLRGMYAHLAERTYKEWKDTEEKAVDMIRQMKEVKADYALCVTFEKKKGMYDVILSVLCHSEYSVERFHLNRIDDDMEFDDWYQSIDMNYAITQGILDELEIDFVIDNEQWIDCFYEMQNNELKSGSIFEMELGAM